LQYGRELKPLFWDTDTFLRESVLKGEKVLLEGAQGTLLSIDHGTYPYVTSSDCSIAGLAKGAGLKAWDIDLSLGIIKGFYMTRVGEGPFPTELGGKESDRWCNGGEANEAMERELFKEGLADLDTEFSKGIGIRLAGNEYGATTKRPRRTGWLDLPLLRHALEYGSKDIILTKLDVLNDCDEIKICNFHKYLGFDYNLGEEVVKTGDLLGWAVMNDEILENCLPIYTSFPGWNCSLKGAKCFGDLPAELKTILHFIIKETGINPRIISIGPDRDETIFLD
jgi:adenylosuccinate synthase